MTESTERLEREAFEAALPFIGSVLHVFSTTTAYSNRDGRAYLEGVTELCWRTWRAALAASQADKS